jgi:hypothetical protein
MKVDFKKCYSRFPFAQLSHEKELSPNRLTPTYGIHGLVSVFSVGSKSWGASLQEGDGKFLRLKTKIDLSPHSNSAIFDMHDFRVLLFISRTDPLKGTARTPRS